MREESIFLPSGQWTELLPDASKQAMNKKTALVVAMLVGWTVAASAQSVDLAVLGGGYIPVNQSASVGNAFALEGNVGIRVFHVPFIALYGELPVMGTLSSKIRSTSALLNT